MNTPGFTADTSLYITSRHYQSVTTRAGGGGEQSIISQIRVGGFVTGGFGGIRTGFLCEAGCAIAYGACLAACTATGPLAAACVFTCTALYDACTDGC